MQNPRRQTEAFGNDRAAESNSAFRGRLIVSWLVSAVVAAGGCSGSEAPELPPPPTAPPASATAAPAPQIPDAPVSLGSGSSAPSTPTAPGTPPIAGNPPASPALGSPGSPPFAPVQIGAVPNSPPGPASGNAPLLPPVTIPENRTGPSGAPASAANDRTELVIAALKPLQVLLGNWKGLTNKSFGGFKAIDQPAWVWDLRTEPQQPALVMHSDESPYFRDARLTFLPETGQYRLTFTDPDKKQRVLSGTFTEPPHDVPGDDQKLQRKFKLQLTQTEPADDNERWQLTLNQQENNRHLIEISKARGTAAFRRFDTVAMQREGTSFAVSDTDYGEKTCVISQGLGTIAVSYQGRSYWVCCTGCKAAFEENPEKWIARYEKMKAEEK